MTLQINWSDEAILTLSENLEFLNEKWSTTVINSFLDSVEQAVGNIIKHPKIYPIYDKKRNIHKCVLHHRVSMYYQIKEKSIEIPIFWGNAQHPQNLKI